MITAMLRPTNSISRNDDFDLIFRDFFGPLNRTWTESRAVTTVSEDETSKTYSMDLPGIKKDDVRITAKDRTIKVDAKTGSRQYKCTVTLTSDMDASSIVATLEDGVLSLKVSKRPESTERVISIT